MRAAGVLLFEAVGLALLLAQLINKDPKARGAVQGFFKRIRTL
jgi:hypothetical protein